jgi:flagellar biosynthesis anti-sigma factor FlgM
MSMKIEGDSPNIGAPGTQPVDLPSVDRSTEGERRTNPGVSVQHSSVAQLAAPAALAVTAAPDIRQDKVDAARKALEVGSIGQDPYSLADKLIDSLLGACND